jgi:ligand-binding sensor domain-containing protein
MSACFRITKGDDGNYVVVLDPQLSSVSRAGVDGPEDALLEFLFEPDANVVNPYIVGAPGVTINVYLPDSTGYIRTELTLANGNVLVFEDDAYTNNSGETENRSFTYPLDSVTDLAQGVTARVILVDFEGVQRVEKEIIPPFIYGVNALSLAEAGPDALWVGTSHDGLLLLRRDETGSVQSVHYAGGLLSDARPTEFQGPQGNMITRLELQGYHGVWMGSWARGLTYLDAGDDLFDPTDDRWAQYLPPDPLLDSQDDQEEFLFWLAQEFRETVTALLADGDKGIWVGTMNGLYYLDHDGRPLSPSEAVWTRLEDGVVLAIEAGDEDEIWVGFATDIDTQAVNASWLPASSPLLRLRHGGTPDDTNDDLQTWLTPGVDAQNNATRAQAAIPQNVLSLLATPGGMWVGTDNGLFLWVNEESSGSWLSWSDGDGVLYDGDVSSLANADDGAIWIGAFDVCGADGGALMRFDHGNTYDDDSDDHWLTYSQEDGLKDSDVSGIVPLADGNVAFTTFNLDVRTFSAIGFGGKAEVEGCVSTGKDGVTLINIGGTPDDSSDDEIFDF